MHLIVDGYGGDAEKLANENVVWQFLERTPLAIDMTKIAPPFVYRYQSADSSLSGISGFVVIAQSHLALHTWPERGIVWADIFSCKSFKPAPVTEALRLAFGLQETRASLLQRGLEPEADLISGMMSRTEGK